MYGFELEYHYHRTCMQHLITKKQTSAYTHNLSSLVPRLPDLSNARFSVCNIEKLREGLGTRQSQCFH